MTTENTINELPPLTPEAVAEEFIKANTTSVIIEEFVNHYNTIESLQRKLTYAEQEARNQRSRWASMAETIEEFLKEHIKDEQVSVDDLKELAEELEIELTKEIEVTFKVDVTATVTVPIDFNDEDIEESDFDIRINYEGSHNDVECDDIEWSVENYYTGEK
jgi:sugar-specific transcriptional regulator TrmB